MISTKERHLNKFNRIMEHKTDSNTTNINTSKWIINLSSKELTTEEKSVLSKEMNYCVTPKSIPSKDSGS